MALLGVGKNKSQVRGFSESPSGVGWDGSHSLLRGHVDFWPVPEGNRLGRDTQGVEVEMTPPPRKSQSGFRVPACLGPWGWRRFITTRCPWESKTGSQFLSEFTCGCGEGPLSLGPEHPLWGWGLGAVRLPPSGPLWSPGGRS